MKQKFSKVWKASVQPRKQRKYKYNAPLHIKTKMLSVHLSTELRKKYGKRNIPIRKGDKVKILRGQFKKKTGKVESVSHKKMKVFVNGIEMQKKEGSKILYPLEASNLVITELNTDDKKRLKRVKKEK